MVMINIQKKDLFLIGAIFIFLLGVGMIISSNGVGYTPEIHGHLVDEIEGILTQDYVDTEIIKMQSLLDDTMNTKQTEIQTYVDENVLVRGVPIYQTTGINTYCQGDPTAGLTLSLSGSTCQTKICDATPSDPWGNPQTPKYYTCDGGCSSINPRTCSSGTPQLIGYVIGP